MQDEVSKENQGVQGDAVDQLENDFDAFFEYLTNPTEGGADGEKTT